MVYLHVTKHLSFRLRSGPPTSHVCGAGPGRVQKASRSFARRAACAASTISSRTTPGRNGPYTAVVRFQAARPQLHIPAGGCSAQVRGGKGSNPLPHAWVKAKSIIFLCTRFPAFPSPAPSLSCTSVCVRSACAFVRACTCVCVCVCVRGGRADEVGRREGEHERALGCRGLSLSGDQSI